MDQNNDGLYKTYMTNNNMFILKKPKGSVIRPIRYKSI